MFSSDFLARTHQAAQSKVAVVALQRRASKTEIRRLIARLDWASRAHAIEITSLYHNCCGCCAICKTTKFDSKKEVECARLCVLSCKRKPTTVTVRKNTRFNPNPALLLVLAPPRLLHNGGIRSEKVPSTPSSCF